MAAPRHFTLDRQRFALHIEKVEGQAGRGLPGGGGAARPLTVGCGGAALPKKEAKMSIEQFIDNEVKSNDVVLFMKGTPQFPQCGFSGQVVQILDHVGVPYKGLNVLESAELRNGIKVYSNWPTIPQLYVKGEFVGGCDIIREMFQAGELQQLFADKGIVAGAQASA
jgi:monothiol glutaredoxin